MEVVLSKVAIGSPAPNFSLMDMRGNLFELRKETEKGPILLVFNRGFV